MNTETVGFTTVNGQTFTPGVQGFSNASAPPSTAPNTVSPNAIRWLFNPFAFVNISERPVSGHAFLKAGVFIPITNQTDRQSVSGIATSPGKAFDWQMGNNPQPNGLAEPGAPAGSYRAITRTAYEISSELEDAYSERGVRILPSLTAFDDEAAVSALHKTLVAEGLRYNNDPYQPDYPVPNLLLLEKYLVSTASKNAQMFNGDLKMNPSELVAEILLSVRQAKTLCLEVTREAKRVIANKTVGYVHAFDAYQGRCFIALGEEVPSDLPYVAQSGQMIAAGQGDEVSRLRDENEKLKADAAQKQIEALQAENAALKALSSVSLEDVAVIKCDAVKADGTKCKSIPVNGTIRCRHHQSEVVAETDVITQENKENVS